MALRFMTHLLTARTRPPRPRSLYELDAAPLGSGEQWAMFRGVEKSTKHVVAVKVVPKSESKCINIQGELDMLRRFGSHPNILELVCSYETPSEIHVVVEYMYGGALVNVIPRHGLEFEQDAVEYTKDIAAALCYLHKSCVAHRNLTLESLMLTHALGGMLKVCDFRCAKILPTENAPMWGGVCGAWGYAAPEVFWSHRTSEGSYTLKCDLFSVGVILYFLLVGYHPFNPYGQHTQEKLIYSICHGLWRFEKEWYCISSEAKSVVAALLEVDPVKRLSARQLACHPWIRESIPFGHSPCVKNQPKTSVERISSKLMKVSCYGFRLKSLENAGKHCVSTNCCDLASNNTKRINDKAAPDELASADEQARQQSPLKGKLVRKGNKEFRSCLDAKKAAWVLGKSKPEIDRKIQQEVSPSQKNKGRDLHWEAPQPPHRLRETPNSPKKKKPASPIGSTPRGLFEERNVRHHF